MKILTRLRELRMQNPVEQLFDNFHFSVELSQSEIMGHDEVMGIGTTTYDDIHRLSIEHNHFEKS